jgi:hypothetical protein
MALQRTVRRILLKCTVSPVSSQDQGSESTVISTWDAGNLSILMPPSSRDTRKSPPWDLYQQTPQGICPHWGLCHQKTTKESPPSGQDTGSSPLGRYDLKTWRRGRREASAIRRHREWVHSNSSFILCGKWAHCKASISARNGKSVQRQGSVIIHEASVHHNASIIDTCGNQPTKILQSSRETKNLSTLMSLSQETGKESIISARSSQEMVNQFTIKPRSSWSMWNQSTARPRSPQATGNHFTPIPLSPQAQESVHHEACIIARHVVSVHPITCIIVKHLPPSRVVPPMIPFMFLLPCMSTDLIHST